MKTHANCLLATRLLTLGFSILMILFLYFVKVTNTDRSEKPLTMLQQIEVGVTDVTLQGMVDEF